MRKKLFWLLGAMLACSTFVNAQTDKTLSLSYIAKGWGWNCKFSYDTINPSTSAGIGCTATAVTAVTAVTTNGGSSFAIAKNGLQSEVFDWEKYERIDMLVYPTKAVSFGSNVQYKGYVNNANVQATSNNAVTSTTLIANEWQIISIDLTKSIVDDATPTKTYTSLSDVTLGVNTIELGISGTTVLFIGEITAKLKSTTPPTGITLSPSTISLIPNKTLSLVSTVTPTGTVKDVNWSSDNTSSVSVNAGTITTIAEGTATIKATSTVATTVSGTSTITVVAANPADSKIFETFENKPLPKKWTATSVIARILNPTKGDGTSINATDSALQVTLKQWEAIAWANTDLNKINKITWMVYSDTAITGLSIKTGINNDVVGVVTKDIPAKTWTKMEWEVTKYATNTADDFFIQLASNGTASFLIDQVEFIAGTAIVLSSDATLKSLTTTVGTFSPAFAATTLAYSVTLPAGTIAVPTIAGVANDANAKSVVVTPATALPGSTTVVVTAEDNSTKTYTVAFTVAALSSDATLKSLTTTVGTFSPAFAATTLAYSVTLPAGTIAVPTIAGVANDANAKSVVVTPATALPGSTTVVVTAEDNSTKTYTIAFTVATSVDENKITASLYPNPTSDVINVTVNGEVELLEVVDFNGHVVKSATAQTSISVANLAPGTYFARITTTSGKVAITEFKK